MFEENEVVKEKSKTIKIKPLRDYVLKHNEFYYEIVKGEEIEVDKRFKETLKTEKVTR